MKALLLLLLSVPASAGIEPISGGSVGTAAILTAAITTAKLATDAVTSPKILTGAVTQEKIGTGAVETAKVGTDAITAAKILTGAVTARKLGSPWSCASRGECTHTMVGTADNYDNFVLAVSGGDQNCINFTENTVGDMRICKAAGATDILTIGGSVTIGGGSAVAKVTKTASGSIDLGGSTTANCTAETNVSITGVAVGDACIVTTPAAIASTDWIVCRTLTDNVALKYCTQGAAVDPAAMVYHITTIEY